MANTLGKMAEAGQDRMVWMGKSFALSDRPEGRDAGLPVQKSGARIQKSVLGQNILPDRLMQFIKFCLVGGSGVFVDMGVLFLLADPKCLGLNITLSKIIAAETALINNFIWNELWTFRQRADSPSPRLSGSSPHRLAGIPRRFLMFNAICGIGIGLAVLLLHMFHTLLGWHLYLSNLLAIVLVTIWNFGLNAKVNWSSKTA